MTAPPAHPFPATRPPVAVRPIPAEPFDLTLDVLPGWGVELALGTEGLMAWYDPPGWTLTSVSRCQVKGPARIHNIGCLEISMCEWDADGQTWKPDHTHTHFARLADDEVQWLATARTVDGVNVLYTFLDEGFDRDWGTCRRHVSARNRVEPQEGGALTVCLDGPGRLGDQLAGGMFEVRIGERTFTCLRVFHLDTIDLDRAALEGETMAESFYTRDGRLVLFRRYNGRTWKAVYPRPGRPGQAWDRRLPDNQTLLIDGALFVHWYDCLTDV